MIISRDKSKFQTLISPLHHPKIDRMSKSIEQLDIIYRQLALIELLRKLVLRSMILQKSSRPVKVI
jgi:hypothetical protein